MSFQGFGKNSGPGAPPTAPNPFAGNFPRASTPPLASPTQPLFAPPSFHPSIRPRAASPKWADEYPTLAEAYNGQTHQRPAVTPSMSIPNTGRGDASKSFQAQDKKRERSLPSLFPDEGALRNSNTVSGRPRFSSPVWPDKNKLPGQFSDSNQKDLSSVSPNLAGYGIGRTSPAKQDNVQVPKITRSPPVKYDDIEGFSEDSISVQTDSRRLSTRLADRPNAPVSHSHVLFAPSIRTISTEATATKPPNSTVPKRSRSPSLNPSDKNFQGNSYDAQDDTERELQAKAKRLARFKDELSQPEPSSVAMGNQKVPLRGHDQAMPEKRNLMGEPLELTADANTSTDFEGPDSSSIIAGLCPEMCPDSERAERERKGDLDRYERVDGDRNQTSKSLAVKKYTRTAEREASLIRPMPILQKTMNYLLELLDQPYDDGFLGLYNFLWDRMRAIRMDLRMQHIFNLEAITMLEQMIRLHIIAMHELCEYTKGEGFSEGFDAHLNIEQMNKTSVELFQLYDDHRKNGIDVPTEKEFRGYYALLKLDKHPGYKVEPAELSLDLAKMTPEVRQAPDVLFARDVARSCRIGNFIAFFRLVRKSSYLQACLMHAHFSKLRTQALASLHSGLQSNQGIPVAHVARWLGMEDEDVEDLLDYHGFSIKEFGEPYMVKEGPFLNLNDSGTPKCSKLVHLKKCKTMFEDVLAPSLMEQVPSREVKEVSFNKVYGQEPTPVQFNVTQSSRVEEEMDSEPVSTPTKDVQTNPILKAIVNTQQSGDDHQVAVWSHLSGNISQTHDPSESMDHRVDDARTDSSKFKFRNSLEKNKYSDVKTNALDIVPRGGDRERLPVLEMDVATEKLVHSPESVNDLNGEECISTREDLEIAEAGTNYLDEELSQAKLKLILWKWRRHAYRKKELRKKKQLAADAALSSLSLGPPLRHYEEQQSNTGEFNIHHVMRERYDRHERSWSKLNVSEVVADKLSERNASSKCLCWKVVVCSQMDRPDGDILEHRSNVSSLAAGTWFCSKIIPAGDCSDDDLITSFTGLSIWKKWINDLSHDELVCCLSIIKDTRCDNPVENVAGASAVMFLVYECIPLELQKLRLRKLVMSLPSGSGLPLLILSDSWRNHSDPSLVANVLGLNEIDKSRISCFSIVFLLENQNTVFRDGFFSDYLLREGLQWLASNSPSQPVLQSVKTQELVFAHLNPFIEVLDGRSAYNVTPLHCISAFNDALDQSIKEVLAAADSNPSCWPCPEIALLESSDEHKAVDCYVPKVGWSSAAGIEPVTHALNQCKLPAFPDDTSWLFCGSNMGDDIENQKSRLEDCLSRYLSQTSQMMGLSLAKQEAHAVLQKCARLELHESTYYIVPKWVMIFRRVCNWRLMKLLNREISTTYVLKQNDSVTTSGEDNIHDEGDISHHSTIEPSLDEMLEVSCSLLHYPENESSQTVRATGLNHIRVLNAAEDGEVVERERESQQNNNLRDIDNGLNPITINSASTELAVPYVTKEADRLSELLEKCNMVQNMIDKNLSIYF